MALQKEDKISEVINRYLWLKIFRLDIFLGSLSVITAFLLACFTLFQNKDGNCEISYKHISNQIIIDYDLLKVEHRFRSEHDFIDCNLYQAKFTIRNSGRLAVDSNAIKRPMVIELASKDFASKIIDCEIFQNSNQDYSIIKTTTSDNHICLIWNELSHNYIGNIYILYKAKQKEKFNIDGYITNVKILNEANRVAYIWYKAKSLLIPAFFVIIAFVIRYFVLTIAFVLMRREVVNSVKDNLDSLF